MAWSPRGRSAASTDPTHSPRPASPSDPTHQTNTVPRKWEEQHAAFPLHNLCGRNTSPTTALNNSGLPVVTPPPFSEDHSPLTNFEHQVFLHCSYTPSGRGHGIGSASLGPCGRASPSISLWIVPSGTEEKATETSTWRRSGGGGSPPTLSSDPTSRRNGITQRHLGEKGARPPVLSAGFGGTQKKAVERHNCKSHIEEQVHVTKLSTRANAFEKEAQQHVHLLVWTKARVRYHTMCTGHRRLGSLNHSKGEHSATYRKLQRLSSFFSFCVIFIARSHALTTCRRAGVAFGHACRHLCMLATRALKHPELEDDLKRQTRAHAHLVRERL